MAESGTAYVDVKATTQAETFNPSIGKVVIGEIGEPDNVEINYADSSFITGRLLTLIDATFTDPQQRKAQKDLVKREIRDWMADLYDCKHRGVAHSRSTYTD